MVFGGSHFEFQPQNWLPSLGFLWIFSLPHWSSAIKSCTAHAASHGVLSRSGVAKSVWWLGYGLNDRGLESRQRQDFFPPKRPDRLWGQPNLLLGVYRGSLPGVKRPVHGVGYLSSSSAADKYEWRYTSSSPTFLCWWNKVRVDKFNVYEFSL